MIMLLDDTLLIKDIPYFIRNQSRNQETHQENSTLYNGVTVKWSFAKKKRLIDKCCNLVVLSLPASYSDNFDEFSCKVSLKLRSSHLLCT